MAIDKTFNKPDLINHCNQSLTFCHLVKHTGLNDPGFVDPWINCNELVDDVFNPLSPNINIQILQTDLHIFLYESVERTE